LITIDSTVETKESLFGDPSLDGLLPLIIEVKNSPDSVEAFNKLYEASLAIVNKRGIKKSEETLRSDSEGGFLYRIFSRFLNQEKEYTYANEDCQLVIYYCNAHSADEIDIHIDGKDAGHTHLRLDRQRVVRELNLSERVTVREPQLEGTSESNPVQLVKGLLARKEPSSVVFYPTNSLGQEQPYRYLF